MNFFQVCGRCECHIEEFNRLSQATDTSIELSYLLNDDSFIGFGYCQLNSKQLNQLADLVGLELIFVELA